MSVTYNNAAAGVASSTNASLKLTPADIAIDNTGGSWTQLEFTDADADWNDSGFTVGTNTITVSEAGKYLMQVRATMTNTTADGYCQVGYSTDNAAIESLLAGSNAAANGSAVITEGHELVELAAGTVLRLFAIATASTATLGGINISIVKM